MKIQCSVCEAAEANVLCCADEAALCWACDEKVHAANKLASKHQRVPLSSSSSQMPKCDICQEAVGYFFCLEDRALLCRKCDVAIHTANTFVSAHQRFLLTGVEVGLELAEPGASSSIEKSHPVEKISKTESCPVSKRGTPMSMDSENKFNKVLPVQAGEVGETVPTKVQYTTGSAAGSSPQWQFDEFLSWTECDQSFSCMDHGSSKADSSKLGDSDCSSILRSVEEELDTDECLGQVPEISWMVPQISSPPTASGLNWPKNPSDSSVFVPDIFCSPALNSHRHQRSGSITKRRRQF